MPGPSRTPEGGRHLSQAGESYTRAPPSSRQTSSRQTLSTRAQVRQPSMTTALQAHRDEAGLIRLICAGDREHFHALVQPYERAVYSTAFSVLGNAADAEDVAQEVFLKALKNLATFRGEAKFSTWLIQIAFNEARMALRRSRRKQYESIDAVHQAGPGDYVPRDFADWREIPSEALARKELRHSISKAVMALKPIYRDVLVLRDMRHLSVRETADLLGVSNDVVKTRLLRARLQLRDALAPGYDGGWTSASRDYRKVRPW